MYIHCRKFRKFSTSSLSEHVIFRPSIIKRNDYFSTIQGQRSSAQTNVHECLNTMENVLSVLALLHILKYFRPSFTKREMTVFRPCGIHEKPLFTILNITYFCGISRKDPSGRKTPEPVFRNPRVGALFIKWRTVWLMAMDRHRKLRDALDYLEEVNTLLSAFRNTKLLVYSN